MLGCRCMRYAVATLYRARVLTRKHQRHVQTACTVYNDSLGTSITEAIRQTSAPHHGFTSLDMPSQALLLISRHYFPELSAQGLAEGIHATVTQALGDDNIEVVSAVVDEIPTSIAPRGAKGVSLLLVSEDELASIQVFVDEVNRDISLGRAWKSQGDAANVETMDDQWVPSGDWKALLSGGTTTAPSQTNTISAIKDAKSAIIISKPEFSAIDWPAQMLPNAFKYGLTPAKTPFLTGLPITMTHNKTTLKNGGFALVFRDRFKTSSMTHARLKILGDSLRVSK